MRHTTTSNIYDANYHTSELLAAAGACLSRHRIDAYRPSFGIIGLASEGESAGRRFYLEVPESGFGRNWSIIDHYPASMASRGCCESQSKTA